MKTENGQHGDLSQIHDPVAAWDQSCQVARQKVTIPPLAGETWEANCAAYANSTSQQQSQTNNGASPS